MEMNLDDFEKLKGALSDSVKLAVNEGTKNLEQKIDNLNTTYEKDQEIFKEWKKETEDKIDKHGKRIKTLENGNKKKKTKVVLTAGAVGILVGLAKEIGTILHDWWIYLNRSL